MNRRTVLTSAGAAIGLGLGAGYVGTRSIGSMSDYDAAVGAQRSALAAWPEMRDLLRFATLAPSGHNTQPWRFRLRADGVDVVPDPLRRTPVVDPDDHHLFVSLGAAAENLSLAASARGLGGELGFDPEDEGLIKFRSGRRADRGATLFDAISHRQSTRADYDGRAVSPANLKALAAAAYSPDVDLVLISDRPLLNRVRDLVVAGNTAQLSNPVFMRELALQPATGVGARRRPVHRRERRSHSARMARAGAVRSYVQSRVGKR